MSIVPRYEFIVSDTPPLGQVVPVDNGELCKYADHVAAVAEAEQRVREVYESSDDYMLGIAVGMHDGFLEGYAAALDAVQRRVLGLTVTEHTAHFQDTVLFHIDALRGES